MQLLIDDVEREVVRAVYWQDGTTRVFLNPEKGSYGYSTAMAQAFGSPELLEAAKASEPPLVKDVDEWHYHLLDADGVVLGHGDHYTSEEHVVVALQGLLELTGVPIEAGSTGTVAPEDAARGKVSATGSMHCTDCGAKVPGVRRRGIVYYEGTCPGCSKQLKDPAGKPRGGGGAGRLGSALLMLAMLPTLLYVLRTWALGTVSDLVANSWLDALCRAAAYSEAEFHLKLHIGDPGSAGTNNAAAETTRKQVTFGAGAASRTISNTVAAEWTNVSTTETYSWVSAWDATAAGNFLGRDDLSSTAAVTAGDTFRVPIADLDISVV